MEIKQEKVLQMGKLLSKMKLRKKLTAQEMEWLKDCASYFLFVGVASRYTD